MLQFFEQHLFTCSFKLFLGIDCPGCGMQRAFIALLKGNFAQSLVFNASLIPFLITIGFTICHLSFSYKNGARLIVVFFSCTVAIMMSQFIVKLIASTP